MRRLVGLLIVIALAAGTPAVAGEAPGGDWEVRRSAQQIHDRQADEDRPVEGQADRSRRDDDDRPRRVATTESDNFNLLPGKLRWLPGPAVEYRIVDAPFGAAEEAVEAAVATVDRYVTTRTFVRKDRTRQTNPCTGEPNTIRWARLDGPRGTLGLTEGCFNTSTHEIGGFVITLDSGDRWAIGLDGDRNTFDVQSVATHEMGHAVGLDHVTSWRDACLTMFALTGGEEIQKRTLGLGDKLGLNRLYHHGDTAPGPGCGR